jgi:hypothetical protein
LRSSHNLREGPERGKLLFVRMPPRTQRALSIEYEGIICEVLGRHLLPSCHYFERINLARCAGNTGFALWDCPSCDESRDQAATLIPNKVLPI